MTTTETPSMAREEVFFAFEHYWTDDASPDEEVDAALDAYAAAVRAEAMTEDARHWQEIAEGYLATLESVGDELGHLEASLAEAVGLLRVVADMKRGPESDRDAYLATYHAARAFLSRFPESEGGAE